MSYIQGFVVPVPHGKKEDYRRMASEAAAFFKEYGAVRIVECWEDKVPDGKVTDFRRAVNAEQGESIVFSWIEWPDAATYRAAEEQMPKDDRMAPPPEGAPFDPKRMIYGGFAPLVDTNGELL